jgi:hypothetical protein
MFQKLLKEKQPKPIGSPGAADFFTTRRNRKSGFNQTKARIYLI